MSNFERRLAKAEDRTSGGASEIKLYLPPNPCPDWEAFARECEADAAALGVMPIIIRFVKPGEVPRGPLQ